MIAGVDQLLYHEAFLLDEGRYQDWLRLLATDLRYWAPVRANVPRAQEQAQAADRLPLFDETKASLSLRVARLETGAAWIDVPPTRTRHLITNVMAEAESDGRLRVRSNFMVYRSRNFGDEWFVVGCREDRWSHADEDRWLLHERMILFDHATIEVLPLFL